MSANNPTIDVAVAHIQTQGVYATPEIKAALNALFCTAETHDAGSVERLTILSTELVQRALFAAQSGTPQTVTFAPDLAHYGRGTWEDLCKFLGVEARDD
jgi:hypothetical protein